MPKHKLTPQQLLKGAEKALQSKKTPKQLKPGIRNALRQTEGRDSTKELALRWEINGKKSFGEEEAGSAGEQPAEQ